MMNVSRNCPSGIIGLTGEPEASGKSIGAASGSPPLDGTAVNGSRMPALARALQEDDRVVLRMVPDMLVSWDYGKGDSRHQSARRKGSGAS